MCHGLISQDLQGLFSSLMIQTKSMLLVFAMFEGENSALALVLGCLSSLIFITISTAPFQNLLSDTEAVIYGVTAVFLAQKPVLDIKKLYYAAT